MNLFRTWLNTFTFSRGILGIILGAWVLGCDEAAYPMAAFFFACLAATDMIDGRIARLFRLQSRLGSLLDPAADRALIYSVLVALLINFQFDNALLAYLILSIARDVLVYCKSVIPQQAGSNYQPDSLSKVNCFIQSAALIWMLAEGRIVYEAILPASFFLLLSITHLLCKGRKAAICHP